MENGVQRAGLMVRVVGGRAKGVEREAYDVIVEGCPGNGEAARRRVRTPSCVATAAAT